MQSNEKSPFLPVVKALVVALLLGGIWWGWRRWEEESGGKISPASEHPVEAVRGGKKAVEFIAQETLQGKAAALSPKSPSPTILHFWGTWCGPCVAELPELLELARKAKTEGIRVVAVAMDDRAAVDKFLARYPKLAAMGEHMEVVIDPKGRLADLYQVTRFPETFLINRQFLVDNRFVGPQSWLSNAMRPYLDRIKEENR